MTKAKRKKKRNKGSKSSTIVSPSTKTAQDVPLPHGAAKLQPEKAVLTSKEIFVAVPAEVCFSILASQLEQLHKWDEVIVNVKPVSKVRKQIGATSEVTLKLGGKRLEALAMVSRYQPNHAISWVLTTKPKVRQDWRLEVKPHGTLVGVTLAHELGGQVIGRLIYKVMYHRKMEQNMNKMLAQLKVVVEGINRNEMVGG